MNQVGSRLQKLTGSLLSTVSINRAELTAILCLEHFKFVLAQGIYDKVENDFKALYGKLFKRGGKREVKERAKCWALLFIISLQYYSLHYNMFFFS